MTVINTNTAALRAQNGSRVANQALQSAMERLSSGKRINSAKDDAAGLAIANSMTSQIRGMSQAIRNANDGISLAQTADGALNEVTNMLQRIRELAVQSASGTYSDDDRTNLQSEVTELGAQIDAIISDTKFNGVTVFGSSDVTVDIQTGYGSADQTTLTVTGLDVSAASGADISSGDAGVLDDVVDLRLQRLDLGVHVGAVVVGIAAAGALHRQLADTLQHVGDFAEGAFRRLGEGDAVIGVADRLVHAPDLRGHVAGDGEAGGVVLGRVDALAGRQALHGSLEGLVGDPAAVLRTKRSGIGVDDSHSTVPFPLIRG